MPDFGIVYYLSKYLVLFLCKIYFRVSFHYDRSIDWKNNYLVVANHASFLDPPLLGIGMKQRVYFLAKEELERLPILGRIIFSSFGCVPVKRGTGDIHALKAVISSLNSNKTVGIFPEGTRTLNGNMRKPRPGIGMIAYYSKATILPLYIHNSFKAMPKNASFPKPVKIQLYFGKPYRPVTYTAPKSKEVYQEIAEEMMKNILKSAPEGKV